MQKPIDVLTPGALSMLQTIAFTGSFAAAARALDLVPSALTYRVRLIEDALDVLLFDRSARQAKPTEAGVELLREGAKLLAALDHVANRVKRVATGWEALFTIAADNIIDRSTLLELTEAFFAMSPPTQLKIRDEVLSGTIEGLRNGQADLAIGGVDGAGTELGANTMADLQSKPLGVMPFVYVVAPQHPLAKLRQPVSDEVLRQHRAIAIADSVQRGSGVTVGLLGGQDVLTVANMQTKLEAQLRGLGGGFLPEHVVRPYIASGQLVPLLVERSSRAPHLNYMWRATIKSQQGKALSWWLSQLERPATRRALVLGKKRK